MVTPADEEPVDKLMPVNEAQDLRVPALLRWVFNHFVHFMAGAANEQLIFIVNKAKLDFEPWCATINCFSVLDQQECTFTFKLAD